MKEIYTQEVAQDIVNVFEDLLEEHNIDIPDEDRTGDESEARLYGMTHAEVLEKVECIVIELLEMVGADYKAGMYNGSNWIKED